MTAWQLSLRTAATLFLIWSAAPVGADSLSSWGLSWESTKAELAPSACQQMYDELEICQLATVPRPLPHKDFYTAEFSPAGKLLGLSYVSQILPAATLIDYFNQLTTLSGPSTSPRTSSDFDKCRVHRACARWHEKTNIGAMRLEYYLAAPSVPPFSMKTGVPTPGMGRLIIKMSSPALLTWETAQPPFTETSFALTSWLAATPPQAFTPKFLGLAWGQTPQELLTVGVRCHDIQLIILCHPPNKVPLPGQTRLFSVVDGLGLMKMDLLYYFEESEKLDKQFAQLIDHLPKKFTNLTRAPALPNECSGEYCPTATQRFFADYSTPEDYAAEIQITAFQHPTKATGFISLVLEKNPSAAEIAHIARKIGRRLPTLQITPPQ